MIHMAYGSDIENKGQRKMFNHQIRNKSTECEGILYTLCDFISILRHNFLQHGRTIKIQPGVIRSLHQAIRLKTPRMANK